MGRQDLQQCTAFDGSSCIASGDIVEVAGKTKEHLDQRKGAAVLIFDDLTGEVIEVDFRGTKSDVLKRLKKGTNGILQEAPAPRGPGRPRLGVVSREVTLLPRHWEWLNSQPGGASVALRKLVEEARRVNSGRDRVRQSQEAAFRFMSAMAGNLPGYEEATRALFAGDRVRFDDLVSSWPADVRSHSQKLAQEALGGPGGRDEKRQAKGRPAGAGH